MKLKREDVYRVYSLIGSLKGKFNKHFQMYLFDITNALESTFKSIQEVIKPSDKFIEFETKRNELLKAAADIDENGQPKTHVDPFTYTQSYNIPSLKMESVKESIRVLKEEYKDAIEENIKQQPEIKKLMEDEIDIPITLIPFSLVPDEMDIDILRALSPYIDRGEKK
jgi:uncharacterized protein YeeX (DUF496 family)